MHMYIVYIGYITYRYVDIYINMYIYMHIGLRLELF